jgi:hypothetical protein
LPIRKKLLKRKKKGQKRPKGNTSLKKLGERKLPLPSVLLNAL